MPLTEDAIRAELPFGARCALMERGGPILVAVPNDAIVSDGGKLIHVTPSAKDWGSLVQGGRFAAANLIIEIKAAAVVAQRDEEVERGADVSITRGRYAFKTFHGPPWVCGS
jgi:hypothetical protein